MKNFKTISLDEMKEVNGGLTIYPYPEPSPFPWPDPNPFPFPWPGPGPTFPPYPELPPIYTL